MQSLAQLAAQAKALQEACERANEALLQKEENIRTERVKQESDIDADSKKREAAIKAKHAEERTRLEASYKASLTKIEHDLAAELAAAAASRQQQHKEAQARADTALQQVQQSAAVEAENLMQQLQASTSSNRISVPAETATQITAAAAEVTALHAPATRAAATASDGTCVAQQSIETAAGSSRQHSVPVIQLHEVDDSSDDAIIVSNDDHTEPHDYHDGAGLEHQEHRYAAASSSGVASGVAGTSSTAATPVAAAAASTVAARSVQQGAEHKATAVATKAAPAVAATAAVAAAAAAQTVQQRAQHEPTAAAEQHQQVEGKQVDTAAVREALTLVLRAVLAMSSTHMQELVGSADLWQQSLYALQYDAAVAYNTLQSLFKPDCTLSWCCMLCDLLVSSKYTTLLQHTGRWHKLPQKGIVYAADLDLVIDVKALQQSHSSTDKLIATLYTVGETVFKQQAVHYLIAQLLQSDAASDCRVPIDDQFMQLMHAIQVQAVGGKSDVPLYEQNDLARDIRHWSKCCDAGFCTDQNYTVNSTTTKQLVFIQSSTSTVVYDLKAMLASDNIVDKIRYLALTGHKQPTALHDVRSIIAAGIFDVDIDDSDNINAEMSNEIDELMQQVQDTVKADFRSIISNPARLAALQTLHSKGDTIKLSDVKHLSSLFESKTVAEVTETATFSIHMNKSMCRVLPLVNCVSKQQYTPNTEYVALLEAVSSGNTATAVTRSRATAAATGSKRKGSNGSTASGSSSTAASNITSNRHGGKAARK
jgi:hypothetical protein